MEAREEKHIQQFPRGEKMNKEKRKFEKQSHK